MKRAKKLVCGVLAFALLFSFAVPVQAQMVPTATSFETTEWMWGPIQTQEVPVAGSFDFATQYRLAITADGFDVSDAFGRSGKVLANGFELGISGTLVTHNPLAFSSFTEVSIDLGQILDALDLPAQLTQMMTMLGINLAEPFRVWVEADLNNVNNLTYVIVVELPMLVRTVLSMTAPWYVSQFWVLDLSNILAEAADELELALLSVTPEQQAEILAYAEEAMAEAIAIIQAFVEEYEEEIADFIAQAHQWLREVFTLRNLDFGHKILENGYSAFLDFAFTGAYAGYSICVDFSFAGEITNIGTAVAVPLPELTEANSLDLFNLF